MKDKFTRSPRGTGQTAPSRMGQAPSRLGQAPSRMGPWRLLDIFHATMPFRAGLFGGAGALPEYGPADPPYQSQPEEELPGSNISEGEQRAAVERERARRFIRSRRPSAVQD